MSVKKPCAVIFGAGATGESLLPLYQSDYNVLAFIDNDEKKIGKKLGDIEIYSPDAILRIEYDIVIIGTFLGGEAVVRQLVDMGVPQGKIHLPDRLTVYAKGRVAFLEGLKDLFNATGVCGAIAEGGVFKGEYAREINRLFPGKKLYLFDTFEGFDERDTAVDNKQGYSTATTGNLGITSEDAVLNIMPHPEMCIVRKGYFPETAEGINDKFCFVNLDFDLYQPMLAGLEYFYPRMVKGGVILVNDYFLDSYGGVRQALKDFTNKTTGVRMTPIGDGLSIAVCC